MGRVPTVANGHADERDSCRLSCCGFIRRFKARGAELQESLRIAGRTVACAIVHDVQPCAACARVGRREHSGELGHTPDARRTSCQRVEASMLVHAACRVRRTRRATQKKQPSLATRAQEERRNRARSCASTSQAALARQLGSPARPACQDARPRGRCSQPTRSARHGQFARGTARGALLGAMLYSRRARTARRMVDADTSRELWADGDGMRERLAATGC